MPYPLISDYSLAIQKPIDCFSDRELKSCGIEVDRFGFPQVWSGGFACVYKLRGHNKNYAVKCFYIEKPELRSRYDGISRHLRVQNNHYLVEFEYMEKGIYVNSGWFPILKMRWVEGAQLNDHIEKCLNDTDVSQLLRQLSDRWQTLLDSLQKNQIAHGDLQHGNVLVTPMGNLALVDYDGMYVPTLKGKRSIECGHPNYQHPGRNAQDYDEKLDEFSGLAIRLAIEGLAAQPDLWDKYSNDQNLLFTDKDFIDPDASTLFKELRRSANTEVVTMAEDLILRCKAGRKPPRKKIIVKPTAIQKIKTIQSALKTQGIQKLQAKYRKFSNQITNKAREFAKKPFKVKVFSAAVLVLVMMPFISFRTYKRPAVLPVPPIRPAPQTVIPSDPKLAKIYEKSGDETCEKGDYQRALEFYKKAFGLDPENMDLKEKLTDCDIMADKQKRGLSD